MTDWLPIVGDLVNCITGFTTHPFGIELSTECIESNLIPRVALNHINQMSNVVISGTNPAPRNRSWFEVNGPAIALIVVMAIVCAIAVFAVVMCVMCERRARKRKSESADDEELSEASENPLADGRSAREIEQVRGQQTVSRCSSLYGAHSEQSGTEEMMTYGAPVSEKDAKTRGSAAPTNENLKSVSRLREGSEGAPRTAPNRTAETVPTKAAAPSKPYSNPPPSSHVQGQRGVPQYQPYQLHPQNPQYQPYLPPQQPQRYPQYRGPQQYPQHQYYPAYQTPA